MANIRPKESMAVMLDVVINLILLPHFVPSTVPFLSLICTVLQMTGGFVVNWLVTLLLGILFFGHIVW